MTNDAKGTSERQQLRSHRDSPWFRGTSVDLKWLDALNAVGLDHRDYSSCWPEKMFARYLVLLQRPVDMLQCEGMHQGDVPPSPAYSSMMAMQHAVMTACVDGSLAYVDGANTDGGVLSDVLQERCLIKPQDFADWLRKLGEEPSIHIAHWFKARGVTATRVLQLAPPVQTFDAVAKLAEAVPAYGEVSKPEATVPPDGDVANRAEASDDEPAWLTSKNYNMAWLLSERDRLKKIHGERGHYMKKLVAHLKSLGVDVPGKDPAREIRRVVDAGTGKKKKKEAATFVSGLGGRKSGGTC